MESILEIKDLNLWYGEKQALRDVTVELPQHEITALCPHPDERAD